MAISALAEAIKQSRKTVFFGGAGISTASGIPDFRSSNGLYQTEFEGINPEVLLSHSFFFQNTEKFYRYLRGHMYYPDAKPNDCHLGLALLEKRGLLHSVITQNIDGLHQRAGSQRVIELHGNMNRFACIACEQFYGEEVYQDPRVIPRCQCGGILKPLVTLYEEMLDETAVEGAIEAIASAELLMIGGTSLSVYPAAGFIRYFNGRHLVVMNQTPTTADSEATWVFREPVDEIFDQLVRLIDEA